jgi:hypothetical protein
LLSCAAGIGLLLWRSTVDGVLPGVSATLDGRLIPTRIVDATHLSCVLPQSFALTAGKARLVVVNPPLPTARSKSPIGAIEYGSPGDDGIEETEGSGPLRRSLEPSGSSARR